MSEQVFIQLTHLKNVIFFPHRGPPPPDQPPYERDPGDPYTFYLPWVMCGRRRRIANCGGCGNNGKEGDSANNAVIDNEAHCTVLRKNVNRLQCFTCTLPEKGP